MNPIKLCLICSKPISSHRGLKSVTCSTVCAAVRRERIEASQVEKECPYCMDRFSDWPTSSRKTCSKECAVAWRAIKAERPCKICGVNEPYGQSRSCLDCIGDRNEKYNKQRPQSVGGYCSDYEGHIKRAYGLSKQEYETIRDNQGNACLICRREMKLVVDHNHLTGEVRGLLCYGCNNLAGIIEKTPERLNAVQSYLGLRASFPRPIEGGEVSL